MKRKDWGRPSDPSGRRSYESEFEKPDLKPEFSCRGAGRTIRWPERREPTMLDRHEPILPERHELTMLEQHELTMPDRHEPAMPDRHELTMRDRHEPARPDRQAKGRRR